MINKIALGSIFIECNHFGGTPADLETFERSQLDYDSDILAYKTGTVGGMVETLGKENTEIYPLLVASACPSRHITQACYEQLKDELLSRLKKALPVQGVLLALHGAAAAENVGDIEGDQSNPSAQSANRIRRLHMPNTPTFEQDVAPGDSDDNLDVAPPGDAHAPHRKTDS